VLLERKALIPVEFNVIMVVRLIVPWNPLVAVRFRLEVPFVPRGSVRTLGLSDRVKSGVGVAKVGMVPWNVGLDIARGPNVAATRRMAITAADKRGNRKKYQDICLTLLLFRLGPLENPDSLVGDNPSRACETVFLLDTPSGIRFPTNSSRSSAGVAGGW